MRYQHLPRKSARQGGGEGRHRQRHRSDDRDDQGVDKDRWRSRSSQRRPPCVVLEGGGGGATNCCRRSPCRCAARDQHPVEGRQAVDDDEDSTDGEELQSLAVLRLGAAVKVLMPAVSFQ